MINYCLKFIIILFFSFQPVLAENKVPIELSWPLLTGLNYETGEVSSNLAEVLNQNVEIAGFIVPTEMDEYIDRVREFFLVPNPLACIHVPPPPPNQMIYVKMNRSIPVDMDFRGVAIKGKLLLASQAIQKQHIGFELLGTSAKEANIEFEDPYDFLFENYEYDL